VGGVIEAARKGRANLAASHRMSWWYQERQVLAVWPAILVLFVWATINTPAFASPANLLNVLQQAAVLSFLTLAMLLVLLAGKFDLSIESTVGFAPMLAAHLVVAQPYGFGTNLNPFLGLAIIVALGALIGFVNGLLVVRLKLNAFITTLAVLILLRGSTLGISSGRTIFNPPDVFTFLGGTDVGVVPLSVIATVVLFVLVWVFLTYHRVGRNIYAIGGNPVAARAAGIDVDKTVWGLYVVAGILAAIAGVILSGRIGSVVASQGQNEVFDVFAALAIGAVSLNGGRGSVFGALTGVLFLSFLANVLVLSQVPSFWIDASRGAVIVAALVLARYTSRDGGEATN
jgi:simple sugar transport system permease protein